ncbi:phospholipid carrier-dependent glycosyltransferase [Vibrio sp. S4M6]|uniref:phospholipid carrier-dependent glycosyltransferase n=1 Tax=Vibrio sinus TaxID=2946865 RepID=UPI00202A46D0|nr:phospholipid carrier-dependent glycosyltransferase [Vibrio sinus]MCL9780060.1 phospholipid carrier-dependent glycosyltransferase [Vibrio sinus]
MKYLKNSWPVILIGYFLLTYIFPLNFHALFSPDEIRYAEISREMVASGNWVVPHFNGLRYFEKPIMAYWLNAISQILFGENNFAVRLPSALAVLGSAAFLYFFVAKETKSKNIAGISTGIFLSMFLVVAVGTYNSVDSVLSFFLTASFVSFYYAVMSEEARQKAKLYFIAGAFCGAAFLTKGPLALALPVIVVGGFSIWQGKTLSLVKYGFISVLGALVVSLPWSIAVYQQAPDYWHYFFWIENIKRFFGSVNVAQHAEPIWYYIPFVLIGILPWLFVASSLLKETLKNKAHPLIQYALLWALLPFIFFSASEGKIATYILPCMAPIAVLLGYGLKQVFDNQSRVFKFGLWLHLTIALLLVVAIFVAFYLHKLPLESGEDDKVWIFAFIFAFWSACIFYAIRTKRVTSFVVAHMLAPVALIGLFGPVLPNKTKQAQLPQYFIEKIAKDISPDTLIVADYPSTMSAFNWYLKRSDIYLTLGKGEVQYGLSYPDSKYRYIEFSQLGQFIEKKRLTQPVLIEFSNDVTLPKGFPAPNKVIQYGKFRALLFNQVNQ